MCTNARYQLLVDEIDDFYKKESARRRKTFISKE